VENGPAVQDASGGGVLVGVCSLPAANRGVSPNVRVAAPTIASA